MTPEKKRITVGSMFAGIGGICLGFRQAGFEIIWANEIDHAACETYRYNFGDGYLLENDIKKVNKNTIPHFDILTAGFPCQPFSLAGPHKGFEDRRGNLFFQIVDVADHKTVMIFLSVVFRIHYHLHLLYPNQNPVFSRMLRRRIISCYKRTPHVSLQYILHKSRMAYRV